jgi:hypothetical protein
MGIIKIIFLPACKENLNHKQKKTLALQTVEEKFNRTGKQTGRRNETPPQPAAGYRILCNHSERSEESRIATQRDPSLRSG